MTDRIVLHQYEISPFCRKVGRMLEFKGLPYDVVDYNGLRGMAAMRLSKVGKLPVLDVNGQRIQDSTRIARYLDEHYPANPLYPLNAQERALAELWEDWADEVLYWFEGYFRIMYPDALNQFVELMCKGRPAAERLPLKLLFKNAGSFSLKAQGLGRMARADVEAEFCRHLDRIDIQLSATGWLVGNAKSIADIAVGSQLLEVVRTSEMRSEIAQRERVSHWLKDGFQTSPFPNIVR